MPIKSYFNIWTLTFVYIQNFPWNKHKVFFKMFNRESWLIYPYVLGLPVVLKDESKSVHA